MLYNLITMILLNFLYYIIFNYTCSGSFYANCNVDMRGSISVDSRRYEIERATEIDIHDKGQSSFVG